MEKSIILNHELVPRHEILKEPEVAAVLHKFGISTDQLPKIREDDPVAKAIDAKKGEVLKITRKSQTSGKSVYYRLVI